MNKAIGAVSAGHESTADAAAQVLKDGGNAFDAVIAAHLTACVAEPVLASFGGGGFLMVETAKGERFLYDFFVQTPRRIRRKEDLHFFPISADFGYAIQEFHIGPGSVATPGSVEGIFKIYDDLCTLPFSRLSEQAISLAREGIEMNSFQSGAIDITKPIYFSNKEAADIYKSLKKENSLIQEGEKLKQPYLADFIEQLSLEGKSFFYEGEIAEKICSICAEKGGHLTQNDLTNYSVIKRKPLLFKYRDSFLATNPPPSSGGLLIAFALRLLESAESEYIATNSELLAFVQKLTNRARIDNLIESSDPEKMGDLLDDSFVELYKKEVRDRLKSYNGTTQISVMDSMGNLASLTISNGSGSGVMIPETGVMLNNMLGEEDLNPKGFYKWQEDTRISSMMAPTIMDMNDGKKVALGSGGSNRIRTAILQVLLNLTDKRMSLKEAIQEPRIHFENDFLNIESGFPAKIIKRLSRAYPENKIWEKGNLFFGGVNAVAGKGGQFEGFGDPRRGGVAVTA